MTHTIPVFLTGLVSIQIALCSNPGFCTFLINQLNTQSFEFLIYKMNMDTYLMVLKDWDNPWK